MKKLKRTLCKKSGYCGYNRLRLTFGMFLWARVYQMAESCRLGSKAKFLIQEGMILVNAEIEERTVRNLYWVALIGVGKDRYPFFKAERPES
jgi:ribosome-associated protein YbcJ (S4-like RNA binding protein)